MMNKRASSQRLLREHEIDYLASKLFLALRSLRVEEIPNGDLSSELSLIINSTIGKSGRILRSARDIIVVLTKLGGSARFRDFQMRLPYYDSTISRALSQQLRNHGIVRKENDVWVFNSEQLPIFNWLISHSAQKCK